MNYFWYIRETLFFVNSKNVFKFDDDDDDDDYDDDDDDDSFE